MPAVKGRSQKDTNKAENAAAAKPGRSEMLQYEVWVVCIMGVLFCLIFPELK